MQVLRLATLALAASLLGSLPGPLAGQSGCATGARPRTLDGPRLLDGAPDPGHLRWGTRLPGWACPDSAGPTVESGLALVPLALRGSYRYAYPVDRNNGAVWEGKGATFSLIGGARWIAPNVRLQVAPRIAFQENGDFATAPVIQGENPLGYPYQGLDWPQRFGEAAFWTLDPGESGVAVSAGWAEIAVGTDNVWWGPARRYPILLGSSGPGFPHADVGFARPVSIGVGDLRARLVWGRLDESAYFDARADDDLRLLTGLFLELQPRFFPGFTVGLSGVQHNHWSDASRLFLDLFTFPFKKKEASEGNGLLSLTAEWTSPTSDFAVYTEWARDDYWLNTEDVLTEPDHSQAYTIGFEKLYRREGTSIRLAYELAHLGMAPTEQTGRSFGGVRFYTHFQIPQGHSHRGQLLGAWIGPGSDAQYLAVDLEGGRRVVGGYVERIRRNEDEYYANFGDAYGFRGHDLEWTVGLQGLEPAGPLRLQWQGGVSRRKNRSFIGLDRINWVFRRESNLELTVTAWWLPGL
jgi:hypothetical protein